MPDGFLAIDTPIGLGPVSWAQTPPTMSSPIFSNGIMATLYQWGPIQFRVHPLNVNEIDHETGTDWARKEIAGAAIYREWVGENDESYHLRGEIFPYRIGGMTELEAMDAQRRAGIANLLIRGQGDILGWFVCEKLHRAHHFLSSEGVGQQIQFEAQMSRIPMPAADDYLPQLWRAGVLGN